MPIFIVLDDRGSSRAPDTCHTRCSFSIRISTDRSRDGISRFSQRNAKDEVEHPSMTRRMRERKITRMMNDVANRASLFIELWRECR